MISATSPATAGHRSGSPQVAWVAVTARNTVHIAT
jgi:hypothetical protein